LANTVLITGTSSGIGRITAELFSTKSWNVAACSRNPQTNPFPTSDSRRISLPMDLTSDESVLQCGNRGKAVERLVITGLTAAPHSGCGPWYAKTAESS
jgi:NADP-dependent 3-hydroxy acid dehydrogenase YdfG